VNERIEAELALLRLHYDTVEHIEAGGLHWFRVAPVRTADHWSAETTPAVFSVTQGYPGAPPYGFYVPADLMFKGAPPAEHPAPHQPPFVGTWRFLSWNAEGWRATADVASGSNLWGWVRGFVQRFREGK
jgi:hypothetical protein